jgi:hypothetical protein
MAGDAAHIHLPAGGQGMNMGMRDAFNLGWKLAAVMRGDAPEDLLDTYQDERHTADADILKIVRAQSILCGPDPRTSELYGLITHLVGFGNVNRYLSTLQAGLDIRYPMAGEHPLLGRRVPDVSIRCGDTTSRIYNLPHPAKPYFWISRVPINFARQPSRGKDESTWFRPAALQIRGRYPAPKRFWRPRRCLSGSTDTSAGSMTPTKTSFCCGKALPHGADKALMLEMIDKGLASESGYRAVALSLCRHGTSSSSPSTRSLLQSVR